MTKTFKRLTLAVGLAVGLSLAAPPAAPAADLQNPNVTTPALQFALSNLVTLATVAYTNVPAASVRVINVPPNKGIGMQAWFRGSSALCNTNVIGLGFAISSDGTNYSTGTNWAIWHMFEPNGSTVVRSWTNIPASVLNNAKYLKLAEITNNTLSATNMFGYLTNIVISTY